MICIRLILLDDPIILLIINFWSEILKFLYDLGCLLFKFIMKFITRMITDRFCDLYIIRMFNVWIGIKIINHLMMMF